MPYTFEFGCPSVAELDEAALTEIYPRQKLKHRLEPGHAVAASPVEINVPKGVLLKAASIISAVVPTATVRVNVGIGDSRTQPNIRSRWPTRTDGHAFDEQKVEGAEPVTVTGKRVEGQLQRILAEP